MFCKLLLFPRPKSTLVSQICPRSFFVRVYQLDSWGSESSHSVKFENISRKVLFKTSMKGAFLSYTLTSFLLEFGPRKRVAD